MRLDPNHDLSPATIEAIQDLFAPTKAPMVDDAMLLRLALGIADDETRRLCASAILASPSVRARLIRLRANVHEEVGRGSLDFEERTDLGRLAAFPGSFTVRAAAAVFPEPFGDADALARLASDGWLDVSEEGGRRFSLPERVRVGVSVPDDEGMDTGWPARFCDHHVGIARAIDGTIAEGRWSDGAARLRRELPNLEAAWRLADRLGMHEEVESLARSLTVALLESGAREAFGSLLAAGYRAAESLQKPRLTSWLLSYEGVAAARAGDTLRARALWIERLGIARTTGNRVAEADVLLDLTAQAYSDEDYDESRRRLDEAEIAVAAAGRADYAANVWAMRAVDSLRVGRTDEAILRAERALDLLSGVDGIDWGLFVRTSAAQTLVACGRLWNAIDALTEVLALCAESGRPVHAALILTELAGAMEAHGRLDVAADCLTTALGLHRLIGTRHVEAAERRLDDFVGRHAGRTTADSFDPDRWPEGVQAILRDVADSRPAVSEGR